MKEQTRLDTLESHWLLAGLFALVALFNTPIVHAEITSIQLQNLETSQCLKENSGFVSIDECIAAAAPQIWKYDSQKKSLRAASGDCIDGKSKNTAVILKKCNGKKEQRWRQLSDRHFKNDKTKQCLSVSQAFGTVSSAKCTSALSQQWQEYAPPQATTDTLINGVHGQCLNSGDDPFVDVRNCDTSAVQQWQYEATTGHLVSTNNRCIAVTQAFDLVTLESCSSSTQQKWTLDSLHNNLINDITGQCLDVWGGEIDNEVGVWTCDNSARQRWQFSRDIPPPPSGESQTIINLAQGQCINSGPDAYITLRDCDINSTPQQWVFDSSSNALIDTQGLCIDAATPLELVSLASCTGATTQKWTYDSVAKTYTNQSNGQCLDAWGGAKDTELGIWTCDGSTRQQFEKFQPVTPPGADDWESLGLKLSNQTVAIDNTGKRLFFSLGSGFEIPSSLSVSTTFAADSAFTLTIQGQPVSNNGNITLSNIAYGSSIKVDRFKNGTLFDSYDLVFTNLPVIQLSAALITDEPKHEGTFQLASGAFGQETGILKMGIEIRGATSQIYPKKSFSIQLGKNSDWTDELKTSLLDMRSDGDWILDAAYRDTTLVRNLVSENIFRELHPHVYVDSNGVPTGQSSIRGQLVEVILNGSYHGLYVLSERVDRKLLGLNKVSVPKDASGNKDWSLVDFSDPANGSVLYKASYEEAAFGDLATYAIGYEQKYPKPDTEAARPEPLQQLATLIINGTDADFTTQIGNLMDMDSLVDYWALVLAGQAQDNVQKNFYLARNETGKFAIIPWDFDATFGMFWDGSADDGATWFFPITGNRLFERLLTLPATGFNTKLKARWAELRSNLFTPEALASRFQSYLDQADKGSALSRNFARWPESGGAGAGISELGSATYIRNLLVERLSFVDGKITALP